MVEVVADPGEADPEGEDDHAELEEGSQHLDGPHKPSQTRVLQTGEVVQTGLKQSQVIVINLEQHSDDAGHVSWYTSSPGGR